MIDILRFPTDTTRCIACQGQFGPEDIYRGMVTCEGCGVVCSIHCLETLTDELSRGHVFKLTVVKSDCRHDLELTVIWQPLWACGVHTQYPADA